jgi:hypothetical protein
MSIAVEDDSIATVSNVQADDDTIAYLYPIFTSRGRDNKILEWKNANDYVSFYGDDVDDFDKYGQANIDALGVLRNGGRVFACKLLPTDAKRAYVILGVGIADITNIPQWMRTDTVITNGSVTTLGTGAFTLDASGNKIPIMILNTATPDDLTDTIQLTMAGKQTKIVKKVLTDTEIDSNGNPIFDGKSYSLTDGSITWTVYPIMMVTYYGHGVGGNNFGLSIVSDLARDRDVSDGRRYQMNFFEYLTSGKVNTVLDEPIYFSFNPNALYSSESTVREGLRYQYSNTEDNGDEKPLQLTVYSENYSAIVNALYSLVSDSASTTDDVDFLFDADESGVAYSKVVLNSGSIDLANTVVMLAGGSDGALTIGASYKDSTGAAKTADATSVAALKNTLLISFFNCDIDNDIFDEKIIDAAIVADANYDVTVKRAILSKLPTYRPDIALRIDAGFTSSYREAINALGPLQNYINSSYDFMVSMNGHSGYTLDTSIPTPKHVTYTHDYVQSLTKLYTSTGGEYQMLAGYTNGKTSYVKWDWIAQKDKTNMMQKLEDAKVNYIEKYNKAGDTMYSTETTLYNKTYSRLTSDRNALVIGDAMRTCHKILIKYKYDPRSITSTIDAATTELTTAFRSRYPATIAVSVSIYQTKRDATTDNAHCDISFTFPNFIKKYTVTIKVFRETTSNTESTTTV